MRIFRVSVFLLVRVALSAPALLHAQNTPFQNPSLDTNCYFPQIGVPGEIDTIYGSPQDTVGGVVYGTGLGYYIHNLGQKPDGSFGNLLIANASGDFEQALTGPHFNLHNLQSIAQTLGGDPSSYHFGHFHDRSHLDIFDDDAWTIYWADDNGNYDTAHKTVLKSNIYGRIGYSLHDLPPYISPFSNDSVDDIVLGTITNNFPQVPTDSLFLLFYRGGESLRNESIKFEDTSLNSGPGMGVGFAEIQGDFRGTGRDDLLVADDSNNLYFFRNDPPFTLAKLRDAMFYDTLWTTPPQLDSNYTKNPNSGYSLFEDNLVMHALPKKKGDNSYDFLVWIPTLHDTNNGIFIFRGGPDFGSHRITIDSAAYVITPPQLGYSIWPGGFADAGDMTGTGNHMLYTGGSHGSGTGNYGDQNFYVTGQALDNKIDIFYRNCPAGAGDTLTANSDSLEDILLGNEAYDDPQDELNGSIYHGTIWIEYGSRNIPVHLNPQFANVKSIPQQNGAGIEFSPNPVSRGWSVATIVWPEAEIAEYEVYNLLGSVVQSGSIRMLGGAEQERIYFPNLASGAYEVLIHGSQHEARAKLVIVR